MTQALSLAAATPAAEPVRSARVGALDLDVGRAPPTAPVRVLLVEADECDWRTTQGLLRAAPHLEFLVDRARDFAGGLERLRGGGFDVCLINPALPGGGGLELVRAAQERGGRAPLVVLAEGGSLELDLQAMTLGVADFLDKPGLDAIRLERALRYALARQRRAEQLSQKAQLDDLTGLANRSLFQDRLERALAWARRHERLLAVMILDLNGFKAVNDRLGHAAGDRLLAIMGRRLAGVCARPIRSPAWAATSSRCSSRTSPSPSTPRW